MIRFLFYFFLAYLVYQLVFHFIIPIYRTTQQVKRGFREMNERMNGQEQNTTSGQKQTATQNGSNSDKVGEYIDFEEIKD
ncbi:MAG: DUF4834 family protein [Bacteroidota bacterium]|nr:hypothetical protein [Flavisolibacter sp.]MBD0300517.1 hypothetical protein [Nitrososphaera sp.]MDQ3846737.1 DUF4834 family protein [Bacteroidota bacterium]MBD0285518.1 hypothetical protein [Flavisolibacter sp.]MBD0296161.1 hypothetical protein [Flavisolibacter sp.]